MLIKIWDFLFTRKKWKIIARTQVLSDEKAKLPIYYVYTMQDQFGNIKRKKISN